MVYAPMDKRKEKLALRYKAVSTERIYSTTNLRK